LISCTHRGPDGTVLVAHVLNFCTMKPKAGAGLAALAIVVQLVTGCADQGRFRGRNTEQVKQACDPQRQTPEECSRTLDR
jgi:hypothetical protein